MKVTDHMNRIKSRYIFSSLAGITSLLNVTYASIFLATTCIRNPPAKALDEID